MKDDITTLPQKEVKKITKFIEKVLREDKDFFI